MGNNEAIYCETDLSPVEAEYFIFRFVPAINVIMKYSAIVVCKVP